MKLAAELKIAAVALLLTGTVQAAVLDGQTLGYDYNYPEVGVNYPGPYPTTVVVGAGVEVPDIVDNIGKLDISDTNLLLTFVRTDSRGFGGNVAFNGFVLTDINNTIPNFTSVSINPISTLQGFDSSRIYFDANTIRVNFVGLPFRDTDILSLDVTAVPEPATIALLGLGMLGVAASHRRSGKSRKV